MSPCVDRARLLFVILEIADGARAPRRRGAQIELWGWIIAGAILPAELALVNASSTTEVIQPARARDQDAT